MVMFNFVTAKHDVQPATVEKKLASLGIMGAQLGALLKPLDTIVL